MKLSLNRIFFEKALQKRNSFSTNLDCPICAETFVVCKHTEAEAREFLEFELFEAQKKLFEDERLKKR